MEFTVDDLTVAGDYNQTEFEVLGKGTEGETQATFYGVPLKEVLNRTAVWDNASKVLVKSVDDYEVLFNLSEVMDNPESENPMILALKKNNKYIDMEKGLLQLIVPDDEYDDGDEHEDWYKNKWSMWITEIELMVDE
jgi:DMSO/TMAO reductase YedYZ molybdopterin-dependent catalytic subunit